MRLRNLNFVRLMRYKHEKVTGTTNAASATPFFILAAIFCYIKRW